MSSDTVKGIISLVLFVILIISLFVVVSNYHSSAGVIDLGDHRALIPEGERLDIFSVILKYGYEVSVQQNTVYIHSLGTVEIQLCEPDCILVYKDWPLQWTFEKVPGGVIVTYPDTFYFVD